MGARDERMSDLFWSLVAPLCADDGLADASAALDDERAIEALRRGETPDGDGADRELWHMLAAWRASVGQGDG